MNNGESLVSALQKSGLGKRADRQMATLADMLPILALIVLAVIAVVFASVPGTSPEMAESGGPVELTQTLGGTDGARSESIAVSTSGPALALSLARSLEDPVHGAWSRAEAEQFACSGNNVPEQICSADIFAATP
jgi:hypothetical protein